MKTTIEEFINEQNDTEKTLKIPYDKLKKEKFKLFDYPNYTDAGKVLDRKPKSVEYEVGDVIIYKLGDEKIAGVILGNIDRAWEELRTDTDGMINFSDIIRKATIKDLSSKTIYVGNKLKEYFKIVEKNKIFENVNFDDYKERILILYTIADFMDDSGMRIFNKYAPDILSYIIKDSSRNVKSSINSLENELFVLKNKTTFRSDSLKFNVDAMFDELKVLL